MEETEVLNTEETEERNPERFETGLRDQSDSYTVREILQEYHFLNNEFMFAMDLLMYIFDRMEVGQTDIYNLDSTEYYYEKRKVKHEDSNLYEDYIFRDILQSAFQGTVNKAKEFFGYSVDDWEGRAERYRTLAVKISDKYFKNLIRHIDSLLFDLKELFHDFYKDYNVFSDWFSFSDVLDSLPGLDLVEQRDLVTRTMAKCKEYCIKDGYKTVKKEQEDEYIEKCRRMVDLIDFQEKNGISINPTYAEIEEWEKEPEERNVAQRQIQIQEQSQEQRQIQIQEQSQEHNQEHNQEQDYKPVPETDITLNRQFLALYYMLNELDNKAFSRNKSEIARFIQMLTGKNYDNIYKRTKNPLKDPSERTSAKYQSDIQFVKDCFRNLGLVGIVRKIENDNLIE